TWTQRYSKSGAALATVSNTANYSPTSINDWRQESVTGIVGLAYKPNVRFKFEFTSGGDNNLYIDDINLTGLNVGIDDANNASAQAYAWPNPFSETTEISFNGELNDASLYIYNVFGQRVMSFDHLNGNHFTISRKNLSSGIYFFDVSGGQSKIARGRFM